MLLDENTPDPDYGMPQGFFMCFWLCLFLHAKMPETAHMSSVEFLSPFYHFPFRLFSLVFSTMVDPYHIWLERDVPIC